MKTCGIKTPHYRDMRAARNAISAAARQGIRNLRTEKCKKCEAECLPTTW